GVEGERALRRLHGQREAALLALRAAEAEQRLRVVRLQRQRALERGLGVGAATARRERVAGVEVRGGEARREPDRFAGEAQRLVGVARLERIDRGVRPRGRLARRERLRGAEYGGGFVEFAVALQGDAEVVEDRPVARRQRRRRAQRRQGLGAAALREQRGAK